jgi:esterase/lipase superfamily enzyme
MAYRSAGGNQAGGRESCPMTRFIFALLLYLMMALPLLAESTPAAEASPPPVEPKEYSQLWVDKSAVVTPEAVAATVAGLKKQQSDPDHVVVFIHGFDVRRDSSTAEFNDLAKRLRKQFEPSKARVAFAGVQWDSASDQSVFELANVYWEKISVARSTGRGPTRELLFAIKQTFPKAHVSLMAHSMGCEVAAATIVPDIEYADQLPYVATYQPKADVKVHMASLCGSDLDYDIWSKSPSTARSQNERCRTMWQTVAPYLGKGDRVLSARARLRGKAAGSAFPKMTLEQLDESMNHRQIILDSENIPSDHNFGKYYDDARLARIVSVMLYRANPSLPKPKDIAEIDEIMEAPSDPSALLPYLDSGRYGTLFYTLWRLERLNCGDARHMTDGSLESLGRMLKDKPQMIWRVQDKTDCVTVKKGQFPTERMMTRAGAPPRARKR